MPTDGDGTVVIPELSARFSTPEIHENLQQQLSRVAGDQVMQYVAGKEFLLSVLA